MHSIFLGARKKGLRRVGMYFCGSRSSSSTTPAPALAFIGLGSMGRPMAANLARSGQFRVRGYDVAEEVVRDAAGDGIEGVKSVKEAV